MGALLLDLDGTLVSTGEANYLAYRDALATVGAELTRDAFDGTWGRDSRDFLPDLVPGISPEGVDALRREKADRYGRYLGLTRVNASLVGLLRQLAPTTPTALVTTAKSGNARQILVEHDLAALFDVTVFGDDVPRSKPDPACYLLALERLGVEAGTALAVEDSDAGVSAARAAGVAVLRVPTI
ncbi:HAD-IA family hydrolase [Pseudokineococcus marinus]